MVIHIVKKGFIGRQVTVKRIKFIVASLTMMKDLCTKISVVSENMSFYWYKSDIVCLFTRKLSKILYYRFSRKIEKEN